MTQSILSNSKGSDSNESFCGQSLRAALTKHLSIEKASFHTPGHKGRLSLDINNPLSIDLTELNGLDELSSANGCLRNLQTQLAQIWKSKQSFLSINGATAALTASIIAVASQSRKKKILLARDAHRSALSALILAGLEPIWYSASFDSDWQVWTRVDPSRFEKALEAHKEDIAAALVCSPAYSGFSSDLEELAAICHAHKIPLIVDEAHGAHFFETLGFPCSAIESGADIVIHSLHKTLSAPTQTGVLHITNKCSIAAEHFQAAMNLLQSSSPSYLLMLGIETAIHNLQEKIASALELAELLHSKLKKLKHVKLAPGNDPLHTLIQVQGWSATELANQLMSEGIFPESVLGAGVLLLVGAGSNLDDINYLIQILEKIESKPGEVKMPKKPPVAEQVISPREAFFAESELLKPEDAIHRISSDWIAPCPPGYAIIAPGQKLEADHISLLGNHSSVRVVKNCDPS